MKNPIERFLRPILLSPALLRNRFMLRVASALRRSPKSPMAPHKNANYPAFQKIVKDKVVLHGPFKGMKYPKIKSIGSTIYPKLLGSYESEIAPLVESLCNKGYSSMVDIGCAEGYYAVGFAMRNPGAAVYAFDPEPSARALCEEMGHLNDVSIHLAGFCTSETLKTLDLGPKALIISDCEGYEIYLFSKALARVLAQHDFLIESHDCFNIETTRTLREAFSETHDIEEIESVDDIAKAYTYQYTELDALTLEDKHSFLREGRPTIMRWLYMKSKNAQ